MAATFLELLDDHGKNASFAYHAGNDIDIEILARTPVPS
jgi:serine/threonine protein kinase HipA of HipAB toxin-antitoxin module